jgi:hypothetical protein
MPENCIQCGKVLGNKDNPGFYVKGEFGPYQGQQITICNFMCLIDWDTTRIGHQGAQAVNLETVVMYPLNTT